MSSDLEDGQSVADAVQSVLLKEFHEEFMEFYALAIATAEKHPEQANNEIRNATNHLARALVAGVDGENKEAAEQIKLAKGHLERAKRDCLKITLIRKHRDISGAAWRVRIRDGALPDEVRKRLRGIEKLRKKALIIESRGHNNATQYLLDIVNNCMDLEETLYDSYQVPGQYVTLVRRIWWNITKATSVIILTFFVTLLATLAVYIALPDANSGRAFIESWVPKVSFPAIQE